MNNIRKLPAVEANEWVNKELATERSVEWAVNYHRKCRLIINENRKLGNFYSVIDDEVCMSLDMGLDLEIEQALRALITENTALKSALKNIISDSDSLAGDPGEWPSTIAHLALGSKYEDGRLIYDATEQSI